MITTRDMDDNYSDWMITTRTQWYCSYHPVLSFDVWLHWNIIHFNVNWGEPERAPHKWCIESKSLHSDGTTYVRYSNCKRYGKQLYTLT